MCVYYLQSLLRVVVQHDVASPPPLSADVAEEELQGGQNLLHLLGAREEGGEREREGERVRGLRSNMYLCIFGFIDLAFFCVCISPRPLPLCSHPFRPAGFRGCDLSQTVQLQAGSLLTSVHVHLQEQALLDPQEHGMRPLPPPPPPPLLPLGQHSHQQGGAEVH